MSLPFLLEIGTEEIPDWMIPGALANLQSQLDGLGIRRSVAHGRYAAAAGARAEGLPERQPDTEERVHGSAKIGTRRKPWRASRASRA